MKIPELENRNKKLLGLGISLAVGAAALRTFKTDGEQTYDFSVWGDKVKVVYGDVIDKAKGTIERVAANFDIGPDGNPINIRDIEYAGNGTDPQASVSALEKAVADKSGWSGHPEAKNPLQN